MSKDGLGGAGILDELVKEAILHPKRLGWPRMLASAPDCLPCRERLLAQQPPPSWRWPVVRFTLVKSDLPHSPHRTKTTPAEVAYLLWSAYDVAHFGPVCRVLNARGIRAYFVLRKKTTWHRSRSVRKEKLDHYERMRNLLDSKQLPFANKLNPRADVALTTQSADWLSACSGTKLKAPYFVPTIKEVALCLPETLEGFDGYLVHGQLQKDVHMGAFPESRMKIIGIPKYDAFFQHPPDPQTIKRRLGITGEQGKPIVAYLPTWDSGNSTIHSFHDAFLAMRDEYTIVIHPHPHTQQLNSRTRELDKLGQVSPHVLDASGPTEDAIAIADLLITDVKSGATTESIYLTRGTTPWIGITPHAKSAFFDEIKAAGPIIQDPQILPQAVRKLFRADPYPQAREELARYAYSGNAGQAAEDAADAILELAQMDVISQGSLRWSKLR